MEEITIAGNISTHFSIKKGLLETLRDANFYGSNNVQIFTGNPQRVDFSSMDKIIMESKDFSSFLREHEMISITHNSLVSNLVSDKEKTLSLSKKILLFEMKKTFILGGHYIVLHPGSTPDPNYLNILKDSLEEVYKEFMSWASQRYFTYQKYPELLIETMAGSGNQICGKPEDFVWLKNNLNIPFGICFDTAHVYATDASIKGFMDVFEKEGLLRLVRVVHLNDTPYKPGERKDRHFYVGEGEIPREDWVKVLTTFKDLPMVCEYLVDDNYEHTIRHAEDFVENTLKIEEYK